MSARRRQLRGIKQDWRRSAGRSSSSLATWLMCGSVGQSEPVYTREVQELTPCVLEQPSGTDLALRDSEGARKGGFGRHGAGHRSVMPVASRYLDTDERTAVLSFIVSGYLVSRGVGLLVGLWFFGEPIFRKLPPLPPLPDPRR